MKLYISFLLILLIFIPNLSFCQKETNIWYFGNYVGLDFNYNPPKVLLDGGMDAYEGSSTISDKDGKLLFFTNGVNVYNKEHEVMENGTNLGGHPSSRQSAVIVPKPNEENLYYIFTMAANENSGKHGLSYSTINLNSNNGLGKVTEKNIKIHQSSSESLSVIGSCSDGVNQEYWIAASNSDKIKEVNIYKLNKDGINKIPVISTLKVNVEIRYIKFSPDGKKIVLIDDGYLKGVNSTVIIADFDFMTGKIQNPSYLDVEPTQFFNQAEFSPNGRYLYLSSGKKILQVDLTSSFFSIISSVQTSHEILGDFQIGPDGHIYISFASAGLSIIKNPNEPGLDGKYFESEVLLENRSAWLGLPNFVRSYLYNSLTANAGMDTEICSGKKIILGSKADPGISYKWYPVHHLSGDKTANPEFSYKNNSGGVQEFIYTLTATNDFCSKIDTVKVKVYPAHPVKIFGSKSVCPGVTGVEYSVTHNDFFLWEWEVEGGIITQGQGTPKITVDWGPSRTGAYVKLKSNSTTGCGSSTIELPVRINKILETETPHGPQEVCYNQRQNVQYSTTKTNGSVYNWEISGGTIISGQGEHQVYVNWEDIGNHKIWVHEKSVTIDTVCFGISEVFEVNVFKDLNEIELDYVSIDYEDDKFGIIQANEEALLKTKGEYSLYRKGIGTSEWNLIAEIPVDNLVYKDGELASDDVVYEYKISSLNSCDEKIESLPHRTILLLLEEINENDQIHLQWSPYEGWQAGVERYEIWHKVDHEEEYKLIATTVSDVLNYTSDNAKEGFDHKFRIKAIAKNSGFTSWSNEASLNFNHKIVIPNVFTPNGDAINETFLITKLEMYPENELAIYNRWGGEVLKKINYQNDWNGEGVSSGLYYYSLKIDKRIFKGWVHLLR